MSILEINYEHREISQKAEPYFHGTNYKYQSRFSIHGIVCNFSTNSQTFNQELQAYFPKHWQTSQASQYNIYWNTPQEILGVHPPSWGEASSPDCHFINLHENDWVIQRDFMAFHPEAKDSFVVSASEIDDGFFNFLRYYLPLKLLRKNKILS